MAREQIPEFGNIKVAYQLRVWMLMRGVLLFLVASSLFFGFLITFGDLINEYLVKPLFLFYILGVIYLLRRFITEEIEIVVSNSGITFQKAVTKWGLIKSHPETFVWPELVGVFFTETHVSSETLVPSSFSVFLKDGTYRTVMTVSSIELNAFEAHMKNLMTTSSFFKDIDMKQVGKVANLKAIFVLMFWIFLVLGSIMIIAIQQEQVQGNKQVYASLAIMIGCSISYFFKVHYSRKLRSLAGLD
jgi:hypothetical protein